MFNTYEFETDVVAFLLQQPIYYTQRKKALGSLPFSDKYLARVWKWLKEAQDRYGAWPTRSELLERTKRELKDSKGEYLDLEFSSYEEVIDSLYEKKPTASTGEELNRWVAEQHRQRMVKELADTPLEDLASYFKTHQSRINEFRTLHFQDTDLGLNLFSPGGRQRVLAQAIAYASGIVVPTGFPRLDETLGGGGRQGEVNCILSPTGGGKTTLLINLALNMLQAGKRVVFVYLDSTEEEMATRLLTSYMREPINPFTDQDRLDSKLAEVEARYKDMFFCKQFPMKSASCLDIEDYLNNVRTYCYQLDKEAGKDEEDCGVIHALLVDYMEVLKVEQKGENFWISAEAGAQELNALAISQKVCLWTATQGGTEAMKSDKITLDMAAGAKSRFHAIANVLILCTESNQKLQIERLFTLDVAKIRRPARFLSLPFIMYTDKQLIEENENVAPRESGVAIEAPMQNPEDLGRGSRGATRDAVNSAFS